MVSVLDAFSRQLKWGLAVTHNQGRKAVCAFCQPKLPERVPSSTLTRADDLLNTAPLPQISPIASDYLRMGAR